MSFRFEKDKIRMNERDYYAGQTFIYSFREPEYEAGNDVDGLLNCRHVQVEATVGGATLNEGRIGVLTQFVARYVYPVSLRSLPDKIIVAEAVLEPMGLPNSERIQQISIELVTLALGEVEI